MTYKLIPNASDLISVSQQQIKDNFTINQSTFDIDHVDFNSSTLPPGYHNQVHLAALQADPVLSYPVGMIYEKAFGTAPNLDLELFYAAPRQNAAAQINRYLPTIKAMAQFTTTGAAGNQTISTGPNTLLLNVTAPGGITANSNSAAATFTVNFTSALDYNSYYVIPLFNAQGVQITYLAAGAGFTFISSNLSAGKLMGFMVI